MPAAAYAEDGESAGRTGDYSNDENTPATHTQPRCALLPRLCRRSGRPPRVVSPGWHQARGRKRPRSGELRGFLRGALAWAHPGLVTTEWTKQKRRGVLVDANQNGPGKTTASVYSVRPRAGAPVSTPLAWEEVREDLDPTVFTFDEVRSRIARHGDLFAPVLTLRQSLGVALRSLA